MESQGQPVLVVREGPREEESFPLQGMVCTLGRSSDNTIVLDSSQVSRHHAQIRLLPTGAVIEDMGSTNGTRVNGRRITQPFSLSPGDMIRLADYITFEYILEAPQKTQRLESDANPYRTQAIENPWDYDESPPPPLRAQPEDVEPYEPVAPPQPQHVPVSPASQEVTYEPPPEAVEVDEAVAPRRPRALYVLIGILALLICLCVATAVFLWFAPESFWERVFNLFNIPMPSGMLVSFIELALIQ